MKVIPELSDSVPSFGVQFERKSTICTISTLLIKIAGAISTLLIAVLMSSCLISNGEGAGLLAYDQEMANMESSLASSFITLRGFCEKVIAALLKPTLPLELFSLVFCSWVQMHLSDGKWCDGAPNYPLLKTLKPGDASSRQSFSFHCKSKFVFSLDMEMIDFCFLLLLKSSLFDSAQMEIMLACYEARQHVDVTQVKAVICKSNLIS